MKDNRQHTYHPNTFGLLYGKTTKTACGKRRETALLVHPLQTDCRECQDVVIADMRQTQDMINAVRELAPHMTRRGTGNVRSILP